MTAQRVSERFRASLATRRGRRMALLVAGGAVLLAVAAVLAGLYGKPEQLEAVVYFSPGSTRAQKEAVRAACPTVGRAVQQPPARNELASNLTYPLRYDITEASAQDRAAIYRCVQGRPGVVGISEVRQDD